jgi:hypothetical protein
MGEIRGPFDGQGFLGIRHLARLRSELPRKLEIPDTILK